MRSFVSLIGLTLVAISAHAADAPPTFEKDITPLFKDRCYSCHGIDMPKANLDLRTRAGLLNGGRSGPALVPGSIKDSPLWLNVISDKMPADKRTVSDAEKDMLRRWILAGAPGEGASAIEVKSSKTGATLAAATKLGVVATAAKVDAAIERKLAEAKLTASPPADDAEFLRRVSLDLIGRIPTLEKTIAFLDDKSPDKRAKLIEELLDSPDCGKLFANNWARIITAEEPYLKDSLEKWLAEALNKNRPWNDIVRDLLTATGTGPDTAFIMSNVDNKIPQPNMLAGSTARLFLGLQLQCAECHNHPFSDWKQTDFWSLAAFYSYTRVPDKKQPINLVEAPPPPPKGKADAPPIGPKITLPVTAGRGAGKVVPAKFLNGDEPPLDENGPFRPALAGWITGADNPFFAKAAVNRLWAHFFGRGFVNPIDDLNDDNPPTHPSALDALADEFRASGYDRKHLIRCMLVTQAYQRSSRPTAANREDQVLYSHMAMKVMSPEGLYDSLILALGVKELNIQAGPAAQSGIGATRKLSGSAAAREKFVRFFSTREPDGSTTDYSHGIPQALSLMNDPAFAQKLPLLDKIAKADSKPEQVIESLYLALLNRRPSESELKSLAAYVSRQSEPIKGYSGVLWVLINSPEFVMIR